MPTRDPSPFPAPTRSHARSFYFVVSSNSQVKRKVEWVVPPPAELEEGTGPKTVDSLGRKLTKRNTFDEEHWASRLSVTINWRNKHQDRWPKYNKKDMKELKLYQWLKQNKLGGYKWKRDRWEKLNEAFGLGWEKECFPHPEVAGGGYLIGRKP